MRTTTEALSLTAVALRAKASADWAEFLRLLDAYADDRLRALLSQTGEQLLVAQGRAVGLAELTRDLKNAPAVAERLEARKTP